MINLFLCFLIIEPVKWKSVQKSFQFSLILSCVKYIYFFLLGRLNVCICEKNKFNFSALWFIAFNFEEFNFAGIKNLKLELQKDSSNSLNILLQAFCKNFLHSKSGEWQKIRKMPFITHTLRVQRAAIWSEIPAFRSSIYQEIFLRDFNAMLSKWKFLILVKLKKFFTFSNWTQEHNWKRIFLF